MSLEKPDTSLKCQPSNSGCTHDSEEIVSHAVEVNKILTSGAEEVSDSQQSVSPSIRQADKSQKSSNKQEQPKHASSSIFSSVLVNKNDRKPAENDLFIKTEPKTTHMKSAKNETKAKVARIYIGEVASSVSTDDIVSELIDQGFDRNTISVKALQRKKQQQSFVVTVPQDKEQFIYRISTWPKDIKVRPFLP